MLQILELALCNPENCFPKIQVSHYESVFIMFGIRSSHENFNGRYYVSLMLYQACFTIFHFS